MKVTATLAILCIFVLGLLGCGHRAPIDTSVQMMTDSETVEFSASRPAQKGYVLSTGDVFDVQFLFQRTLNTRVTVRPDGYVALPVVGEVLCSSRTPAQLDSVLTEAYATYYRDPEVTINVLKFAPPAVYVMGEVRNQKAVTITPGMSMLQALADAGGSTPGGNLGSAILLRRVSDQRAYAQRVDLAKFLKGKGNAWDILVQPYDIIYIPTSFLAKLERFVDGFFGGLVAAPTLYLRGWEMFHTDDVYDTFLQPVGGPSSNEE